MRKLFAVSLVAFYCAALIGLAQTPAPSKYQPSEVQNLRLKNLQLTAQLAQKDLQQAQSNFQASLQALQSEADKIRKDNLWPPDTQFDINTMSFSDPPPKPAEKK